MLRETSLEPRSEQSFSNRHARSELSMQRSGDVVPLLPVPLLYDTDQCSRTHLPFLPARSPRLETDFCSPAETASFRKPPRRGQCSCPISSTQLPTLRPARSALNSHPLPRSSRRRGMFAVQVPLPSSEPEALKLPSDFRSPSGLSSFRIEALNRWLGLRNLPLSPARFPFAPRER